MVVGRLAGGLPPFPRTYAIVSDLAHKTWQLPPIDVQAENSNRPEIDQPAADPRLARNSASRFSDPMASWAAAPCAFPFLRGGCKANPQEGRSTSIGRLGLIRWPRSPDGSGQSESNT